MAFYNIIADRSGEIVESHLTLEKVADLSALDASEIEWAIEEFGRCSFTDEISGWDYTIVEDE